MKEPFDLLSQIQQVDAPPFLWTRIQQKIKEDRENKLSPAFAYLLGLSFVLLISLNVWVIAQKTTPATLESKHLAQTMNLLPNNSLYQ